MTTSERRSADRVEVAFAAQVYTPDRFLRAQVEDLSRTGVRLRVAAREMGFEPTADLRGTAEGVARTLEGSFALDLHCDRLGPLLHRQVELVRIGLPLDAPDRVELCCAFDTPLGDVEAAFLEATLPPVRGEPEAAWVPEQDMPRQPCRGVATLGPSAERGAEPPCAAEVPAAVAAAVAVAEEALEAEARPAAAAPEAPAVPRLPRQRYRALVTGLKRDAPPSLFCHTDLVTMVGVRIAVPRADYGSGPAAALAKVQARYGPTVQLRLVTAGSDVWKGEVRVSGVELPAARPTEMLVTLAFDRRLPDAQLRDLGLLRGAA